MAWQRDHRPERGFKAKVKMVVGESELGEAPETVRRRKECAEVVRALEKAVDVLGELRDTRIDY